MLYVNKYDASTQVVSVTDTDDNVAQSANLGKLWSIVNCHGIKVLGLSGDYATPILFRSEAAYGSGVRDLSEVIEFEVNELGNDSIVDDIIEKGYADRSRISLEEGETGRTVVDELRRTTGRNLKFGLWLTGYAEVKKLYDGDSVMDAYAVSDVLLVDLGPDGKLYAYEQNPSPLWSSTYY